MNRSDYLWIKQGVYTGVTLLFLCTTPATQAHTKMQVAYVPGISIVPDVLLSDGLTPRTYHTAAGLSYWTADLPIMQGDKIKVNVFVATGGAELGKAIVRLDNTDIAKLVTFPWNTVVETSQLQAGYHLIEVWVEGKGNRPQSSTKTLSFYIVDKLPVKYAVKDSFEVLDNRSIGASNDAVSRPKFLASMDVDPSARIRIHSNNADVDRMISQGNAVTIASPELLSFTPEPGSDAVRYAYVLEREGRAIVSSDHTGSLQTTHLRLQPRTVDSPGLRAGSVTLWAWGVNRIGQPSNPIRQDFIIVEGKN